MPKRISHWGCGLLLAALITAAPVWAQQEATQAQLDELKDKISDLQGWLKQAKGQRSDLEESLKKTETQIAHLVNQIQDNTEEARTLKQRLDALRQEQRELTAKREQQAEFLRKQIRAAYAMGRQEYLKVLLNQQSPDRVARLLRYYDYINRERTQRIEDYLATARQLDNVKSEILQRDQRLQAVRQDLQSRRQDLEAQQQERHQLVATLNQRIQGRGDQLSKMQADQARLEELLNAVTEAIVDLPPPRDAKPFPQMRGQLPWPLTGRITTAFGGHLMNGKVISHGWFIRAQEGTPVKAIHGGRVVFSDWIRGFGMVVIIDHGDGFMSLYGHNQSLRKSTGDWVHGGDIIATAGTSGGRSQSGLYFEIRKKGQPIDPISWITKR
ncbi:hypothetical protein BFW38_15540 [Terasakiispira papahanaumokuakeensis]|uniref:M23ase beta-sheet core domain-containing protein n=1 Tax=Terasakiispira papahanaumokuakeensis TaxID=197479 RepID=A0A1E2VCM9_9GAMM|nr:peptidoglycan DD-metalloendopeptidase family protein [Terasakiispira papahanaumokuakeensis]ODC04731.1 hypothetical protein BFW38_15540 [Terasakiispira papahanaumokuakeensis]